jgi:hypothetical protein
MTDLRAEVRSCLALQLPTSGLMDSEERLLNPESAALDSVTWSACEAFRFGLVSR